jgi:cysteine desulfurase / selenocysteine lyase
MSLDQLRGYFEPVKPGYFNTPRAGLIASRTVEVASNFYREFGTEGSGRSGHFFEEEFPVIRAESAEFLGVHSNEVALLPNFSFGINTLIQSLPKSTRILLFENDYPGLLLPFQVNEFEIVWLKSADGFHIDLETARELIESQGVDVVAISHVQHRTGFCLDLKAWSEMCFNQGCELILDMTQSLGGCEINLSLPGISAAIGSSYKWLNAGYGSALMHVKRRFLKEFSPRIAGEGSFRIINGEWSYRSSIKSFEPGHLNPGSLLMLGDALNMRKGEDINAMTNHTSALVKSFIEVMEKAGVKVFGAESPSRTTIVTVADQDDLRERLITAGIRFTEYTTRLRFGIHYTNSKEDLDLISHTLRGL